ncbi:MAG: TonB-dependent receptor [Alphaproteobacteria bacterium]|nr:TonB-dependent receptor [Alphaproteobacteria bacterium]
MSQPAHAQDSGPQHADEAPTAAPSPRQAPRLLHPVTPRYPDEALPEGLTGVITVRVTVGVDGTVTEATWLSGGPEVFVEPALEAARALLFEPATVGGAPVATSLPATFAFAPPVTEEAPETFDVASGEIVVEADRGLAATETHAVVTLGQAELERAQGQDLAEAVSGVSGVVAAHGTANTSKPIIRGQYERRLLLLVDGVRHESQKWGLDHAPEIDPFSAGSISVVKGAAGVRYGPDAVGGVVLVEPHPLRTEPGVDGALQTVVSTNGRRGVAAGRVDVSPRPGLSARVEGSVARGASLKTPTYVLGNTGSAEWNAGARVAWQRGGTTVETAYSHYDFAGGVCYCVEHHSWDEFLAQLDAPAPVGADHWTSDYAFGRPYQAVTHDQVLARFAHEGDGGASWRATWAYQHNHRQEYEIVRENVTGPQYDFVLRTHTLEVQAEHPPLQAGDRATLQGGVTVSGAFQENVYTGLPLVPNYRGLSGGVAGSERIEGRAGAVEVGARYDHLSRTAYLVQSHYEVDLARGTLSKDDCTLTDTAAKCPASYDAGTVSLGGIWHIVADRLDGRLDLSSATRFPNTDELYMNGTAPTAPVYAFGDPELGVETTWGASPTLALRLDWIEAEASAFVNYTDDYIYYAPEIGDDGGLTFDTTIRGAYPRYNFRAIDALFYGADGGITLAPQAVVSFETQASFLRTVDLATGSGLVLTPPDRVRSALRASPPIRALDDPFVEVSGMWVARQSHVDEGLDFAPAPDATFLLGAAVGAAIPLRARTLKIGVEGTNLLNTQYRDYTSLLRYFADDPGRDIRARVGFDF